MGDTYRIQFDESGEIAEDPATEIETKEQFEAKGVPTGGAQLGHNHFLGDQKTQRVQVGAELRDSQRYDDLVERTDRYNDEAERIAHLEAAGRPIPQSTREHMLREYQDIYITWRGFGIDIESA